MVFTLKRKLLLTVVIVVIVSTLSVGLSAYYIEKKLIDSQVDDRVQILTNSIATQINFTNQQEMDYLKYISYMKFIRDPELSAAEKNKNILGIIKNTASKYEILCYFDTKGQGMGIIGQTYNYDNMNFFNDVIIKKENISMPTVNRKSHTPYISYSVPVTTQNGKQIIGAMVCHVRGNHLAKTASEIDIGGGYHPIIYDMETGEIVANGNDATSTDTEAAYLDPYKEEILSGTVGKKVIINSETGEKQLLIYQPFENGTNWSLVFLAPYGLFYNSLSTLALVLVISFLLVVVISVLLIRILLGKFFKPLNTVKVSVDEIASGNADLSKRIPGSSKDEIGSVVKGFNTFIEILQQIISEIKGSKDKLNEAGQKLVGSTQEATSSINQIISNIDLVHTNIEEQSGSVNETANAVNEIASNIESLDQMIEGQSVGVTKASSAIGQMIENISSINASIDKMTVSFNSLIESARNGSEVQSAVNEKVEEIKNQSEALQEANQAIASIAEQTNLLAMNAAIEAAHAGEAGKGFSVVADEIRKLSETSTVQSKTIGEQLANIRKSIDSVVIASVQSNDAFRNVTENIQNTDGIVRTIKVSLEEQNKGSIEINQALKNMNSSTSQVRDASKEMAEGNKAILDEIKKLQEVTALMKESIEKMSVSAGNITLTGYSLNNISSDMGDIISQIGQQVDKFSV